MELIAAVERSVTVLNQVVEEFEKRGWTEGCLPASAMVATFIPNAKVIHGYAVCEYGAFAHSWVRIDGIDFDVAKEIQVRLRPSTLPYKLAESCEGLHRFDRETDEEILMSNEHARVVDLYEKNPKKFRKRAPKWQRNWKPSPSLCPLGGSGSADDGGGAG